MRRILDTLALPLLAAGTLALFVLAAVAYLTLQRSSTRHLWGPNRET